MSQRRSPGLPVGEPGALAPAGAPLASGPRLPGRLNWLGMGAVVQRELTRFRRLAIAFVLAPSFFAVIFFTTFRFALGDAGGTPQGDRMLDYLVPGLIMMAVIFRTVESAGVSFLSAKLDGTIVDLLMAPLGPLETVGAIAAWGTLAGLVTGAAVLAATALVWPMPLQHVLLVVFFGAATALMMTLMGTLFGLVSPKFEQLGAFFNFLLVPISFLSGLFSPIDGYPLAARLAIQLNPIYYAIDGFRFGFLGQSSVSPLRSALVVVAVDAILAAVLTWQFARSKRLRA